ncbi:kinetochore-associated Ndc80 complex subunit nuf2 [Quaeritorhiza haematococci]|nr:kinetochore-associated Ndc80 complex subunit nuf2 [Quaeritorhiza haematococci]
MSLHIGKPSYSFPTLKPPEIVNCMADLSIPFSEEDLVRPQPHRILGAYENLADILMGVTREQYSQPSFAVMEILEYPDLHQESISLMAFYRQLYKLMTEVGVDAFSLRDVIKPEPGPLRRILSAVINFAKFREERMVFFEQCTQKTEEINERKHVLEQQNQDLAEKVNSIRLRQAEQEPMAQKLREVNMSLTNDLRELKKQQTTLTSEIDNLKKQKNELNDKLANNQFLLVNCKQDCNRLKSRIVHSPEKLKQALQDMSNTLSNEKTNVASLEKKARELQSKMDAMTAVEQDVSGCITLMDDCLAERKKYEAAGAKLVADREKIDKKQAEIRDLNVREQQLKRQLNNTTERIARLQKHQSTKQEAIEGKLKSLREEYRMLLNERANNQVQIDGNNKMISDLEEKIAELRRIMEIDEANVQNDLARLRSQLDIYQNQLRQGWSAPAWDV